jgi:hypothetical protein
MRIQPELCDRISWGPFERGPISLVQEWQSNFDDPQKCQEGRKGTRVALESIGFSDPEIANYARQVHGMNAYAANFTFAVTPATPSGGGKTWTWTWTPDGAEQSRMTVHDLQLGKNATPTFDHRVYWFNGQGISYMDYTETVEASGILTGPAEGVLAPPMMYGKTGVAQFTDPGSNLQDHSSFSGTITRFGDSQCEHPL